FKLLKVKNAEEFLHCLRHVFALVAVYMQVRTGIVRKSSKGCGMSKNGPEETGCREVDVLVAGAGHVGLITAVSLAAARPSLRVLVVDGAPEGAWRQDGRSSA